jgi:hypothetical protein
MPRRRANACGRCWYPRFYTRPGVGTVGARRHAVLDAGRMYDDGQQVAFRVYRDVALAAFDGRQLDLPSALTHHICY